MTEDVKIKISSEIDSAGLSELRKQLNENRNELNATSRQLDKTSNDYKTLKEAVREINRVMKLSDDELKAYTKSLVSQDTAVSNSVKAKNNLINVTNQYGLKLGNVKNDISRYSGQLLSMAEATTQGTDAIVNQIGSLGLFAGGWISVASALGLAAYNYRDWIDAHVGWDMNKEDASMKKTMQDLKDETNRLLDPNRVEVPNENPIGDINIPKQDEKDIVKKKEKVSVGKQHNEVVNKEVVLTNELIDKQNDLNKLLAIESTFTADTRNQIVYLNYLESVKKLKSEIAGLQLSQDTLKVNGIPMGNDLAGRLSIDQIAQPKSSSEIDEKLRQAKFAESANKTLSDTETLYGVVSQTMSLIGITTDSFLGKLVSGFGTVLTIMESIKTVNSILSFIPGFASGGMATGLFMAGERGTELIDVGNQTARVYNHSDTMKFMNSNSSSSNVNVYLSGNIDVKAQLRKENKKYRAITIKQ
jgi:hypothetical protein